jgi:hypothetical protein
VISLDLLSTQFTRILQEYRRTQLENDQDREYVKQLVRGFNTEFAKLDARVEMGFIDLSERLDQIDERLNLLNGKLDQIIERMK